MMEDTTITRRAVLGSALASLVAPVLLAEPASPEPGKDPLPAKLDPAIDRGLAFVQRHARTDPPR